MLAFTPAGTGAGRAAAGSSPPARAGASAGPFRVVRLPGYHSGPVENLDALEALVTAPKSGRIVVRIGI